jgi:hypothetical protein
MQWNKKKRKENGVKEIKKEEFMVENAHFFNSKNGLADLRKGKTDLHKPVKPLWLLSLL